MPEQLARNATNKLNSPADEGETMLLAAVDDQRTASFMDDENVNEQQCTVTRLSTIPSTISKKLMVQCSDTSTQTVPHTIVQCCCNKNSNMTSECTICQEEYKVND